MSEAPDLAKTGHRIRALVSAAQRADGAESAAKEEEARRLIARAGLELRHLDRQACYTAQFLYECFEVFPVVVEEEIYLIGERQALTAALGAHKLLAEDLRRAWEAVVKPPAMGGPREAVVKPRAMRRQPLLAALLMDLFLPPPIEERHRPLFLASLCQGVYDRVLVVRQRAGYERKPSPLPPSRANDEEPRPPPRQDLGVNEMASQIMAHQAGRAAAPTIRIGFALGDLVRPAQRALPPPSKVGRFDENFDE